MFLLNFKELLSSTIYKVLIFIGGIIIGILLVLLIYLIISLIHKSSKLKKNRNNIINLPVTEPKEIVDKYKQIYLTNYSSKLFSIRLSGLKEIALPLIKDIAGSYYPSSKDPLLEVSFENLLKLTNRVVDKVENMVNEIINSSIFKIAWTSYAGAKNIVGFFKGLFKKEKEDYLSINVKKLKISFIVEQLDNMKNKPKKEILSDDKKYFILDDFINNKALSLIDQIALEATIVYSNSGGVEL
ncbi:MAG: hypothetical protein J6K18_02265 [Bacilli bacterium]|nr:hypothetical protein [Bacilli bacterium]